MFNIYRTPEVEAKYRSHEVRRINWIILLDQYCSGIFDRALLNILERLIESPCITWGVEQKIKI